MELPVEIKSPEFKREAARFLHQLSDEFALELPDEEREEENALSFARILANTTLENTQIRGLVGIAESSGSIADILDAIKMRVGRDTAEKGWGKEGVGRRLVERLRSLRFVVDTFIKDHPIAKAEDSDIGRLLHLQLCRIFLKHLAAHFEYAKRTKEDRNG